ncbi:hypothetical protein N7492_001127 [Penicillium capsulatum]|uniref:Uncharacterized protein n=1 Tax=Penicillium capsulatum TaxID=69766 RepID=A0A9W9IX36_9EURO|nr:hypothetical protein N7492_001127 [Penicillium capsulatum]
MVALSFAALRVQIRKAKKGLLLAQSLPAVGRCNGQRRLGGFIPHLCVRCDLNQFVILLVARKTRAESHAAR